MILKLATQQVGEEGEKGWSGWREERKERTSSVHSGQESLRGRTRKGPDPSLVLLPAPWGSQGSPLL